MGLQRIIAAAVAALFCLSASAQADRHDVRKGNREFRRDQFKEADVDYRKAVLRDSTSFPANFNLANTQYRLAGGQNAQGGMDEANKFYKAVEEQAAASGHAADYWFNVGDAALAAKDYKTAVDAFRKSLLANPADIDAKENYIYAKKKLEDQEQNGGGGDNDQNQDNNQDNQDNQDQNQDQNQDNQDQNQDNQDQNQDQNDQNQNNPDRDDRQEQPQQQGISPQQAQQMLQAIQAKEKETQEKVEDKLKAAAQSKQKEKNW